jgi:tetratricopeptide (TPR) repeat protein
LADAAAGAVLWSDRLDAALVDLLAGQDALVPRLVSAVSESVMARELVRSGQTPLPTLQSHSLLMSGIACLHRSTVSEFDRARVLLESLAERHVRTPHGNAWLGKWYVMRQVQGLSTDTEGDAHRALDRANRALDCDPNSALALAMSGHVHGFLLKDLNTAGRHLDMALSINPSESLAWLYRAVLLAWQERGEEAMQDAKMALSLSPIDPMRYYYETIAAFAALTAGQFQQARDLSLSSFKGNCLHGSTHRTLAIAQWQLGEVEAAKRAVDRLMTVDPGFTVSRYRARFPGGDTKQARHYADVLRVCGAPA